MGWQFSSVMEPTEAQRVWAKAVSKRRRRAKSRKMRSRAIGSQFPDILAQLPDNRGGFVRKGHGRSAGSIPPGSHPRKAGERTVDQVSRSHSPMKLGFKSIRLKTGKDLRGGPASAGTDEISIPAESLPRTSRRSRQFRRELSFPVFWKGFRIRVGDVADPGQLNDPLDVVQNVVYSPQIRSRIRTRPRFTASIAVVEKEPACSSRSASSAERKTCIPAEQSARRRCAPGKNSPRKASSPFNRRSSPSISPGKIPRPDTPRRQSHRREARPDPPRRPSNDRDRSPPGGSGLTLLRRTRMPARPQQRVAGRRGKRISAGPDTCRGSRPTEMFRLLNKRRPSGRIRSVFFSLLNTQS